MCTVLIKLKILGGMFSLQVKYETMVHVARVTSVCWSPDSNLLASGGLDTNIVVAKVTDLDNSRVMVKGTKLKSTSI